jgi:hypothetical protein
MKLEDFKKRVVEAFGKNLEHATPANVREFLDGLARESWKDEKTRRIVRTGSPDAPLDITEAGNLTYEALVRDFFANTLTVADDQALIMLWMFALELAYAGIEDVQSESFNRLFSQMPRE